jgi:bifunctional UDP-N-acetylglucosamine pyrophosphorylase / glucosamine-1-phosphate N-acetyltransferase
VRAVLPPHVEVALQSPQLGTGHAVQCAAPLFKDCKGTLLLLYGDVPLLRAETLRSLMREHFDTGAAATMITTLLPDPSGYGRIIRDEAGSVSRIVEHKDASEEQRLIREINSGIYCFEIPPLLDALAMLSNDNKQGEYYVTDTVGILRSKGLKVSAFVAEEPFEVLGINNLDELGAADKILAARRP